MTTYTYQKEIFGRKEMHINVPAFAADLAKELGAKIGPSHSDIPSSDTRYLLVNDDLELSVFANHWSVKGGKGKVHISAMARHVPFDDRPHHDSRGTYKFPDAYVSVSRPMATIAKDIKRRVIDASAEPLASTRAYIERRKTQRHSLTSVIAQLSNSVPEMRERNNGSSSNDANSRTLDWHGTGVYLTARAYSDGQVGIDRIGNISLSAFIEIAEILRRHSSSVAA